MELFCVIGEAPGFRGTTFFGADATEDGEGASDLISVVRWVGSGEGDGLFKGGLRASGRCS